MENEVKYCNIGIVSIVLSKRADPFKNSECYSNRCLQLFPHWATLKAGMGKSEFENQNPESGIRNPELRMMTGKFT